MKCILCIACLYLVLSLLPSCDKDKKHFRLISSSHSGIRFNNKITESDSINPIDVTNIYNGGGVGIGDFNNDGLSDIYFTGNMVSNKLYINRGEMQFEDVTDVANVSGDGKWCRGIAVVDINNDGWMDMYVCASMDADKERRRNLLYINKGVNKKGVPVFEDLASTYGLDDTSHSTMSQFFDYDNDGDLDMYLVVNQIFPDINPSVFKPKITDNSFPSTGRLYRNDFDSGSKHARFTNVTSEAGLTIEGYGHGATIADINKDGWKDIYVTNDFISNDLLYINNQDGTFTDKSASYFKHTSANGMGQDIIDINNDALSDIIELDMNPEDNYRKKMMQNPSSYQTFQLNDFFKYQYQYVRNTLQINQGPRVNSNDSIGEPVFSDVAYFSGIAETDWSWAPLVADFNNDGWRDIIVTNGFPKDITDHDFITYRREAAPVATESTILNQIPEVKLHNYFFINQRDCRFADMSKEYGLEKPSFSNGAAYADLDNDGDLDVVINNINDEAFLYENTGSESKNGHYLSVQLIGDSSNRNGLGAWIELYAGKERQAYEQTPYRGYLSTIQLNSHFGLGSITLIDSLIVKWPDGYRQVLTRVAADQTVKVDKKSAKSRYSWKSSPVAENTLFRDVTAQLGIGYNHSQMDYVDFRIQKLLPHKFSEYGPSLAAADLNGDSLDDIFVGGNSSKAATIFYQQQDGLFKQQVFDEQQVSENLHFQDMGTLLFDADGDADIDIYISRGGYESGPNSPAYQDQFYINDGKGNFKKANEALPANLTSKSCVRAADYDKDGDLDLFIAGRVDPWHYPRPVSSFVYRNDSKNGKIKFTDVTKQVAGHLVNIGLVCDAIFSDFDADGWPDLVLAGEWMPLTFLKNDKGSFKNVTAASGLSRQIGWWNSIAAGDYDNDGDVDFVVGNLGLNSFYKASHQYPISIYAKDFDNNGSYDAFPSIYLPSSQEDTSKKEFPIPLRDDAIKQVIGTRAKFPNYRSYATATIDQLFTKEQMKDVLVLQANNFQSVYCRNEGGGKFAMVPLPYTAQLSPINGIVSDDMDLDGNIDLVMNTNDYGTDVLVGRYDALNGLMLKGDGSGSFVSQSILQSGIYIPGNGKGIIKLKDKNGRYLVAAVQNRGPLKVFERKRSANLISIAPNDVSAELVFRNGKKQKHEFYYGCSFLSQSARFLDVNENVRAVTIVDMNGKNRTIKL